MNKRLRMQRPERFVVNLCVFCVTSLLLVLFLLVGYVFIKGSGYFLPNVIYEIQFASGDDERTKAYAYLASTLSANHTNWLSLSTADDPYQRQVTVNQSELLSTKQMQGVAEILFKDGRRMLARPEYVEAENKQQFDIDEIAAYLQKVAYIDAERETIFASKLRPLHEQLAKLDRQEQDNAALRAALVQDFQHWQQKIEQLSFSRDQYQLAVSVVSDEVIVLPLANIEALSFPTNMHLSSYIGYVAREAWYFLSESPKQANTSGGIFPALFGTVVMVLLMTIIVSPFGVLAAIYMNEYAPNNSVVTFMRVCVSNMAAVPSIVYGVFGLGFLIYGVGGNIDALFFADRLPAPTMGSPGVLWASVTMALLTLPVVIVATDEGINRVPIGLRNGSYALGATKSETILNTVIPFASPSILTGIILAIARAAGEVAPLMLLGAVRYAPNLPIDASFPFLHLDRQFMHLGVLIYDAAFSSHTSPKGVSMMFATCSLLLFIVISLNIIAMVLRARLRRRYQ